MTQVDIHNFAREYARAEANMRSCSISERNKALILAFRDACLLHQVCGKVRLIRVFIILSRLAQRLDKDFDQATREDLQRLVAGLLDEKLKPTTVSTYKNVLKRFMGFVLRPDEFPILVAQPSEIAWLRSHVRKRDQPRLQRKDLLTPKEVDLLIRACDGPRDRAFLAMLWEMGARISEVGNLQIAHITKAEYGMTLDTSGKTGHRNVLIISAAPYLAQWLSVHTRANDPDAPLWLCAEHTNPRAIGYAGLRSIIRRVLQRTGIKKRLYPHLFRHSRCTYTLATGIFNEQQAKSFFGWTPDSNMLATYCHLIDQDANDAILRANNITRPQNDVREQQQRSCPRCTELNTPSNTYCTRCTMPLAEGIAYNTVRSHEQTNQVVLQLVEILVKKGLLNEAADAIHHAGLGPSLKALAMNNDANLPR